MWASTNRSMFQKYKFSKGVIDKSCSNWDNFLKKTFLQIKFMAKTRLKELIPRPLANAPKTFNSKKLFKLLLLKDSLSY